jgi:hypothetical protein
MKYYSVIGVGILVLFLSACEARMQPEAAQQNTEAAQQNTEAAQQNTETSAVSSHSSVKAKYTKPGADVRLVNATPLLAEPGQVGKVELLLDTAHEQGVMHVKLSADQELILLSQPDVVEFTLTPGGSYVIPLQFMAQTPGRFYVRLQVSLEANGQTQARSLAIAVQVGDATTELQSQQQKAAHSSSADGDNVISLPAQETISSP